MKIKIRHICILILAVLPLLLLGEWIIWESPLFDAPLVDIANEIQVSEFTFDTTPISLSLCKSGNHIYAVYLSEGRRRAEFLKFVQRQWQPILASYSSEGDLFNPRLITDLHGKNIYFFFEALLKGQTKLYFSKFDGQSWEPLVEVVSPVLGAYGHIESYALAVDQQSTLHLAWIECIEQTHTGGGYYDNRYAVFHRTLHDSELSTKRKISLDYRCCEGICVVPDRQGGVYLLWDSTFEGRTDVFFRHRSRNGQWAEIIRVSSDMRCSAETSAACDSDNILHITWREIHSGFVVGAIQGRIVGDVMYRHFQGNRPASILNLTKRSTSSSEPKLAISKDNNVYVLWKEHLAKPVVCCRKLSNGNWSKIFVIGYGGGDIELFSTEDGRVHAFVRKVHRSGEAAPILWHACLTDHRLSEKSR